MNNRMAATLAAVLFITIGLTACGPALVDKYEEVQPNETAFVVPLEGNMKDQAQLMSVDYLKAHQVSARRIYLQQKKVTTGRMPGDFIYVATEKVIKVDRTPVTMEWTSEPTTGTSSRNEGLEVESLDSVGFWVGGTITSSISEDGAAAYQYWYAGKKLGDVMNQNIRGFILGILSEEFGNRPLSSEYQVDGAGRPVYKDGKRVVLVEGCKESKSQIFHTAFTKAKEFFKDKGVTIESFGASQGLNYTDKEIQEAINKKFVAENDRQVADQELEAQRIRNTKKVEIAEAEKQSALKFAAAQEAAIKIRELEIKKIQAEAMKVAAGKWQGTHGGIVPQGSSFLFGLDMPPSIK